MSIGDDKAETFQRIAILDYEFDEEDFAGISKEAKRFIEQLFTRNPIERATAKHCLASDWIRKFTPTDQPSIDVASEMKIISAEEKRIDTIVKQKGKYF